MTARSIRRAAERKAKKLARRGEARLAQMPASESVSGFNQTPNSPASVSESRLAANRQNAQLSTGPKSDEGKAKSCLNAIRTGLTGRTVLLPSDDAAAYQRHVEAYEREFQPVGQRERDLVQSIADTQWRLLRIPSLETGILALGHLEFSNSFDEHDANLRPGMIEVKAFLKYERQLRNLQLQEARLSRRREKEIAELRALQSERQRKEAQALERATKQEPVHPDKNGFVFSSEHSDARQDLVQPLEFLHLPANRGGADGLAVCRGTSSVPPGQDACPEPHGQIRFRPTLQSSAFQNSM
ncbi:MAG TPA: hypothetical protein VH601_16095 [Bryobacteraceae bacterium]|jgi:hypothetical protein